MSCSSKITPGDTGYVLAETRDQPWRVETACECWGSITSVPVALRACLGSFWTFQRGTGRAEQLQDTKEGLFWTEFKVPEQTLSWWRAGLVQVHFAGQICCLIPRRGECLSSKRRIMAGLLETSSASWEVTQVMEILPWRCLTVTAFQ